MESCKASCCTCGRWQGLCPVDSAESKPQLCQFVLRGSREDWHLHLLLQPHCKLLIEWWPIFKQAGVMDTVYTVLNITLNVNIFPKCKNITVSYRNRHCRLVLQHAGVDYRGVVCMGAWFVAAAVASVGYYCSRPQQTSYRPLLRDLSWVPQSQCSSLSRDYIRCTTCAAS